MVSITRAHLRALAPNGAPSIVDALPALLNRHLPSYGINKPLRVAHFLAQAAHESWGFTRLEEKASGRAYEGRKNLGNVQPGDGVRFKGRGIFQLTGRANYTAYGKRLGLDLIANPALAESPEVSVRVACEYWKAKGLNGWADRDDIKEITRRINGGHNGLKDRQRLLAKAKHLYRFDDVTPNPKPPVADIEEEVPDAPIAAEPPKGMASSTIGNGSIVGGAAGTIAAGKEIADQVADTANTGMSLWQVAQSVGPWVLLAVVTAGAAAYVWYRRRKKLKEQGV